MSLENQIQKLIESSSDSPYRVLDQLYLSLDSEEIRRTKNIRLIPNAADRIGGKHSYAEWAHVIGIFQTLINLNLPNKEGNQILDVGCGKGLLAIASEPFLGKYLGIDVGENEIEFCQKHFSAPHFDFQHIDVSNPSYAPDQDDTKRPWEIESSAFDMVTALSVWTHFSEDDAMFFLKEVERVLKPGARAIITFFTLDEAYRDSLGIREPEQEGRYHSTKQGGWVFDQSAYGSGNWFCPEWATIPESAIGVNSAGIDQLVAYTGLKLVESYPGNWKEIPGIFFQDVLVFEKQ